MNKNIMRITESVEGESIAVKAKLSDLERNFKDLAAGGLFEQMRDLVSEVKRLADLNEKYQMRLFLMGVEMERRGKIIEDFKTEIEKYRLTLARKEQDNIRELQRIRDEETLQVKQALKKELELMQADYYSQRNKYERSIQDLNFSLAQKDQALQDLQMANRCLSDDLKRAKIDLQDAHHRAADAEKLRDTEVLRERALSRDLLTEAERRHKNEVDGLRRDLETDKKKELGLQAQNIEAYFANVIRGKEEENARAQEANSLQSVRLADLDRKLRDLQAALDSKVKEAADLRAASELCQQTHAALQKDLQQRHSQELLRLGDSKDKEWQEKQAELKDTLMGEIEAAESRVGAFEGVAKALAGQVEEKDQRITHLESRLATLDRDVENMQAGLLQQVKTIEETYSIRIEDKSEELRKALLELKDLHNIYDFKLSREKSRCDNLQAENDLFKEENRKLKDRYEEQSREIEQWRLRYKGYVTENE